MSDDSSNPEGEFINAAYADKVKEAFLTFAENLSVGQAEKSCTERFLRTLHMVKKARDLALVAISEGETGESPAAAGAAQPGEVAAADDGLSEEDRAMIEHALSGTTGVARPASPARLR